MFNLHDGTDDFELTAGEFVAFLAGNQMTAEEFDEYFELPPGSAELFATNGFDS